MRLISIEEFTSQPAEILKWVQEHNDEVEISQQGQILGRLSPPKQLTPAEKETLVKWLADWKTLGEKISAKWPQGVSAEDAVKEQRREL